MACPAQKADWEELLFCFPQLCFPELCEGLTCSEALPIRGLCRRACETFGPLALAAAALAKCPQRPGGARGSLAVWMRTWEACAQFSEAKGQSVGVWARCSVPQELWNTSSRLEGEVDQFLVAKGETCLGILAVGTLDPSFLCLLLLSDGSFLLYELDEHDGRRTLHHARTLAELAPLWDFGIYERHGSHEEQREAREALSRLELPSGFEEFTPRRLEEDRAKTQKVAGLLMRSRPAQPARAPEASPQRSLPRAPEPSGAAASCYEEVVHWESAAEIPPDEAQAISRQLWAGHVQRLAELFALQPERSDGAAVWDLASEDSAPQQPATELWDTVFLVGLSRVCDALRDALRKGRELEPVRAAATAAGHSCLHASGASVFLYPEQYPRVLEALREEHLRPHQVLIVEAFLPLLYHEILRLPSRADVRPCSRRPHMLVQEDGSVVAAVERTFIRAPASARRRPESVVQSLRGRREGENPRRRAP